MRLFIVINYYYIYIMNLVILGDSHTTIYCETDYLKKIFNTINIHFVDYENCARTGTFSPYLMNTLSNTGDIFLQDYFIKYNNDNFMMFIFGEPDVRIHFNKQINILNREEDEVINTLCTKYVNKLEEIRTKYLPNTKIIIRYILPQREYSYFNASGVDYIPQGTLEDRVRYTTKMNSKFKELCQGNSNILFLENISYSELTKVNGELKDEFVDNQTHYNLNTLNLLNRELEIFFTNLI